MPEYTLEEVQPRIATIVDAKGPDFIYQKRSTSGGPALGCFYAHEGKPDCIVGHLLVELGVPVEVLDPTSGKSVNDLASLRVSEIEYQLKRLYNITFTWDAMSFLDDLQYRQDMGQPWGEAYRLAAASRF